MLFLLVPLLIAILSFKNHEGLWQRLNLVFMYLPLAVVALKQITQG